MTTPEPRLTLPRSSFAIALKDYTVIRPGLAVTVSAVTLVVALVIGLELIGSLEHAATTVARGAEAARTLHRYNAGLEVWRQMATSRDPAYRRPEAVAQRDSIGKALRGQLTALANSLDSPTDKGLVRTILAGLGGTGAGPGVEAPQAMIVLLARQDAALFAAAATSERGVLLAALLLALTVLAAGMLVVPMAWLYLRHKRGLTIAARP